MTLLTDWISPNVLRTLAMSLLHFLWQGAALAAVAYVTLSVCRSASTRYAVAVAVMVAMLLSPVATFFVLRSQADAAVQSALTVKTQSSADQRLFVPTKAGSHASAQSEPSALPLMLLVEAWFAGVILLSLRSIGGFIQIERLRRRKFARVSDDILELCLNLQDRMRVSRIVRYCQGVQVDVPLVAGWIRPVVLLPISAITGLTQQQLEAVIAHELAHIRRYDAFVNVFQVAVETLLFYHPAVWWLGKRIRAEREHCCDDAAVAVCGSPVVYARALARLAETRTSPQLAMALDGSPLVVRVSRLLGSSRPYESFRTANLSIGLLCLSVALLAGSAFVGGVHVLRAQTPPAAPEVPSPAIASARPARPAPAPAPPSDAFVIRPNEPAPAAPDAGSSPAIAPAATPLAEPTPTPALVPQAPKQSYIDSLKDAGLNNLTVEELISLKIQGVTADYVKSMKELGIKPDPDELVALKIQGVTPDYVKEMRSITNQNLNADALIGMKIQGVTPEYYRQMHDLGLQLDADSIVGMKIQGVTPEYVKEMRSLGLKLDSEDVVGMKIQGVTPEYVKEMRAATGENLDVDTLVGMKIQGVTPAYIKELQSAGFKVDAEDAIAAKIQGITPEFIASARSHGFKDLTLNKLIALKHSGVLDAEK